LKKEKTSSKQSKKKEEKQEKKTGIKALVPLLSKRELAPAFIEAVASNAKEITLLLVIDTKGMAGEFGFATNEIAAGNHLMELVKTAFGRKRKTCDDIIEWGDTATKVGHFAQLHQVNKVFLVKQDNQFYKKLVKGLKEDLKGIEVIEVALGEE